VTARAVHRPSGGELLDVQEMDGVLAAGLEIEQGAVFGQVLFYGRLRRFEHVMGGEEAFDTGHVGLILRIGAQLSGS